MGSLPRVLCGTALCILVYGLVAGALSFSRTVAAPAPPRDLRLSAAPPLVDVGSNVSFTLSAASWPGPAAVKVTFVSPHHGFSGTMQWEGQCACFRLAVYVARRIHSIELAHAAATVSYRGGSAVAHATFQIRGLAPNGKSFAPGGVPQMSVWVSDPTPAPNESEHYCAWVATADGLGVAGIHVKFVVHFRQPKSYDAGTTNGEGVACTQKSIGKTPTGHAIRVDASAGNLKGSTSFTPHS